MARCPSNKISGSDFLSSDFELYIDLLLAETYSITLLQSAFAVWNGARNEWTNIWTWIWVLIVHFQLSECTGAQVKEYIKSCLPLGNDLKAAVLWHLGSNLETLKVRSQVPMRAWICMYHTNTMPATQKRHTKMTSYGLGFERGVLAGMEEGAEVWGEGSQANLPDPSQAQILGVQLSLAIF